MVDKEIIIIFFFQNDFKRGSKIRVEVCPAKDAIPFLFKIIITVISVQVVPNSEVFLRKRMISPYLLCSVFNQTPPSLAPKELYSKGRFNMSPKEAEEEIDLCPSGCLLAMGI